ncbi:MAG TPA: FtsX-like permease family protein [Gemmatimonadales bacterium]|nr:FtsX-like permease family protein [Gemmatimonadales bacterium]
MALVWALRNLGRRPLRTALSLAGIAVASAMLLDMVMLSGGIERSFERLLLGRGFQVRVSPKGALPFDAEASIADAGQVVARLRSDPDIAAAGPVLGGALYARTADSLATLFGYGIDPAAQSLYQLLSGRDLAPGDTLGILLSAPAAARLGAAPGDTLRIVGGLDPGIATAAVERRLVVRGMVRWLYDYRGQPSVGLLLAVMQRLVHAPDRVSLVAVKVREDAAVPGVVARLRATEPRLEVNSVAQLVVHFRERLVYFRQLSYILGTVSLIVTVLLVATLLTITVSERLGEIATLRAVGVPRARIVRQVLAEGLALTSIGTVIGIGLGIATARRLDAILTSFPGLPAALSFFVPEPRSLALAGAILLVAGSVAGLYPAWLAARAPIAATLRAEAT